MTILPTLRFSRMLVKAAVARNEHLVGGFSKSYIAGALSKLGGRRNELPFVFAQAVLVTTSGKREFDDAFQRTLFPVGTVRFTDLAKAEAFPDANLVQFPLTPSSAASGIRSS